MHELINRKLANFYEDRPTMGVFSEARYFFQAESAFLSSLLHNLIESLFFEAIRNIIINEKININSDEITA